MMREDGDETDEQESVRPMKCPQSRKGEDLGQVFDIYEIPRSTV